MASSLYVAIRGDYSQFQEDLTRARGIARQNGTAISNALNNAISPNQAIQGITRLTTAIRQAQSQLSNRGAVRPTIEGIEELARVARLSSSEMDGLVRRMQDTAAANNMRRAMAEIQHQTGMTNMQMARLRMSMGDISGGMRQLAAIGGKTAMAVAAIGAAAFSAGKTMTDNAVQLDQLDKAFGAIMGDADGAAKQLEYVKNVSNKLGLEYLSTAKAAKTFFAASKGTTLEKDMNRIFEAVSKAGTSMSLSSQDMEGVFLALGQMVSKGKVQAEELRGQLGERLPGAFRMAAEAMGMTTAELDKFMADGKLTAEDLLPKLADVMEGRFAHSAEVASGGVQQAINRMSSAWTDFKANITNNEAILSAINAVTSALNGANAMFGKVTQQEAAMDRLRAARAEVERLEGKKNGGFTGMFWSDDNEKTLENAKATYSRVADEVAAINKRTWEEVRTERERSERKAAESEARAREEATRSAAEKSSAEYLKNSEAEKAKKLKMERDGAMQAVTERMSILEASGRRETEEYRNLAKRKLEIDAEYERQKGALEKKFAPKASKSGSGKKVETAEDVIAELQRKKDLNAPKEEAKARREKIQEMQNEANLLKMLADVSGNYSMSQEAQRMLIDAQTASLKEQNRTLIESKPEIEAFIDEWSRLAQMANSGDIMERMEASWIQFSNDAEAIGKHLGDTLKSATDSFADAFTNFCMTGKFKFKDFANSIIADLARIATRAAISRIGSGLMSMFGGSSANPMADFHAGMSANGNVFTGGNISAYSGTIVTRPTVFGYGRKLTAFANGAGIMGEAGPEAILPLTRNASGKLGVQASGGGVMSLSLTIVDRTQGGVGVDSAQASHGGMNLDVIVQQVEDSMVRRAARGKSSFAGYMDQTRMLNSARSMY